MESRLATLAEEEVFLMNLRANSYVMASSWAVAIGPWIALRKEGKESF